MDYEGIIKTTMIVWCAEFFTYIFLLPIKTPVWILGVAMVFTPTFVWFMFLILQSILKKLEKI